MTMTNNVHLAHGRMFIVTWLKIRCLIRMSSKPLRIGTDFSGLETPCRALRRLGVAHRLVFASEKNKKLAKLIKLDFNPEKFYKDSSKTVDTNFH